MLAQAGATARHAHGKAECRRKGKKNSHSGKVTLFSSVTSRFRKRRHWHHAGGRAKWSAVTLCAECISRGGGGGGCRREPASRASTQHAGRGDARFDRTRRCPPRRPLARLAPSAGTCSPATGAGQQEGRAREAGAARPRAARPGHGRAGRAS